MSNRILYTNEDGQSQVHLHTDSVVNHWLTTQNKSHHFRGVTKMVELGNFRSVMP